jgi:hypothetical protein
MKKKNEKCTCEHTAGTRQDSSAQCNANLVAFARQTGNELMRVTVPQVILVRMGI